MSSVQWIRRTYVPYNQSFKNLPFNSSFTIFSGCLSALVVLVNGQTDSELQAVSEEMWAPDRLRFPDNEVVVNTAGPQ